MAGKIISIDLSALEYRIIAHIAREPILIDAFNHDEDIHKNMAVFLTGQEPKNEKERKDNGKTPNYVGIYGAGFNKFWSKISVEDERTARQLYEKVKTRYPAVNEWKKHVEQLLRRDHKVVNLFGRVRYFAPAELRKWFDVVREAVNWIVQSSGHDILKVFLMRLVDRFRDVSPAILLVDEAHDEGVFDVPGSYVKAVVDIMEHESAQLNQLIAEELGVQMLVPIKADITIGETWS